MSAQEAASPIRKPADLLNLGLEKLMNMEVTSVSRRLERLSDAAASIFVITADDIRRSGATSLPEALRLAPNLQVGQVSASGYAISARGFNNSSANKLLVLIDGRSVYTPLFAGVFWDVQDVMIEDIERIEVISGPGGTLWGTNAVNGVINVITRSAKETQGGLAAAGGSNREIDAATRYGGTAGPDGNYRVYGKYFHRNHTSTENGTGKEDAWHKSQGGFRADWERAGDQLTVQGNAYTGAEGQPLPGAISITGVNLALGTISLSGANALARWTRQRSDGSNVTLQVYYDRTERTVPPTFADTLDIGDVQIQQSLRPADRHNIAWGAEFRYAMDRVVNSAIFAFLPARVDQRWASVYAQDDVMLRKDLRLTVGARVERNDYTGVEYLPNARLAWNVAPDQLLWTAVSRTVRAPSRLDRDAFVPGSPPFLLDGGANVRSEVATVYEIGYRGRPAAAFSYSVTAFYVVYDHLRTQEIAPSRTFLFFANGMEGTTSGVEMWGTWQATQAWRLSAGFSGLSERLRLMPGSNDVNAVSGQEGRDPAQSWRMRSSLDLPGHTTFDVTMRRVSALSLPAVPHYLAMDVRYGWSPYAGMELSITGQNLFGDGHAEFNSVITRTELKRGIFVKILMRL